MIPAAGTTRWNTISFKMGDVVGNLKMAPLTPSSAYSNCQKNKLNNDYKITCMKGNDRNKLFHFFFKIDAHDFRIVFVVVSFVIQSDVYRRRMLARYAPFDSLSSFVSNACFCMTRSSLRLRCDIYVCCLHFFSLK